MTRPFGKPPPKAMSSVRAPVGMVSTLMRVDSPNRTIAPLPKLRSIWDSTEVRAFCFSEFSVVVFIDASFFAICGTRVDPLRSLLINCTTRMLAVIFGVWRFWEDLVEDSLFWGGPGHSPAFRRH